MISDEQTENKLLLEIYGRPMQIGNPLRHERILFISHCDPRLPYSGFAYRTLGILRWLSERYSVDLLFPEGAEARFSSSAATRQPATAHAFTFRQRVGALDYLKGILSPLPFHHSLSSNAAFNEALDKTVDLNAYDIMWLNKTVYLPALQEKRCHAKVIVDQHAVESQVWDNLIQNDPRRWAKPFFRWNKEKVLRYETEAYKTLAGVVSISEEDLALTRSLHGHVNAICVPQGVDTEYYCPSICGGGDPRTLLFSGTDAIRNQEAMLVFIRNIFPQLPQEERFRTLWIGNATAIHPALKQTEWLEVTGFVQEVPPYFEKGRIFVAPFTMGEGMKTKLVEALAMGKLIVTTPIGARGLPTSLPFLKVCAESETFAKAIVEFARMPAPEAQELGAAARAYAVRNHSWEVVLNPLEDFLARVVSDLPHSA